MKKEETKPEIKQEEVSAEKKSVAEVNGTAAPQQ